MAPMPFTIEQVDTIEITAGCSKTLRCVQKFIKMQLISEVNLTSNFEVL